MAKKHLIILGIAGAATATVLLGGLAIEPSIRDNGRYESSNLENNSSVKNEIDKNLEQIREFDKAKEELLNSLIFYNGTATIQENYTAVSGVSADTPVIGSVAMVSEDIMAYDPSTEKCYLMARRISLLGDSVKDFEFARVYSGSATVKVMGILTEYYGNGVLQAYDVAYALDGKTGYYLSFASNPARIDCSNEIIYTNPPVKNTYWIQVIGGDEVNMVSTGVFTPEELPSVDAKLIPGMSSLVNERTYNARETLIFEYSGGKVIPKGTFFYNYKKTTYKEVKDFLEELKAEAQKDKILEDASKTLSDAWKDIVSVENELKVLSDTSKGLSSYTENFSGEGNIDASATRNEADMLVNGSDFRGEIDRAVETLEDLEAENGTLRQLEDFSLDGGGEGDKQAAANAMGSLLPVMKEYLSQYRLTLMSLNKNIDELSVYLTDKNSKEAEAETILQNIRTKTDELLLKSACLENLSRDIYGVLLSYDASNGKNETEFLALSRLCTLWEKTIKDFISGTSPMVDVEDGIAIPYDYPDSIVPILKNAVAAIYDKEDDGTISLTMKTDMTVDEVIAYYKSALKDAQNLSAFNMNGMSTLSGEMEEFELSILATANQLGGKEITMVQIILIPIE